MFTRLIPVARTVNAVARQQAVRCMGGYAPAHWKSDKDIALEQRSHMNDLPVPEGSWQENYNKRNSKWNMQLGMSIVALIATVIIADQFNCFYLHSTPPLKKN
ncbi:uncharacterized protein [Littorina saxatilis]|uniref:Deltamethrin resistance protein prag01 domain-containing protein n=1 Tax=Littorina saxatilis TaxID=31220 RepID=A0AAN9B2M4_9CAEN